MDGRLGQIPLEVLSRTVAGMWDWRSMLILGLVIYAQPEWYQIAPQSDFHNHKEAVVLKFSMRARRALGGQGQVKSKGAGGSTYANSPMRRSPRSSHNAIGSNRVVWGSSFTGSGPLLKVAHPLAAVVSFCCWVHMVRSESIFLFS